MPKLDMEYYKVSADRDSCRAYNSPVNHFVANFVGAMNIFSGTIQEKEEKLFSLNFTNSLGQVSLAKQGEDFITQSDTLSLGFRPHTAELSDKIVDILLQDERYFWFNEIIRNTEFLGEFTRCAR